MTSASPTSGPLSSPEGVRTGPVARTGPVRTAEPPVDREESGRTDLRLVAPALAAWAAAALALGAPARWALLGVGLCGLAASTLLLFALRPALLRRSAAPSVESAPAQRPGRSAARFGLPVTIAASALCAAMAGGVAALHTAELRRGPLPELAERYARTTVEAAVTGDPRLSRPRVSGAHERPPAVLIEAEAVRIAPTDGPASELRTPLLVIVEDSARTSPASPGRAGEPARAGAPRDPWLGLLPSTRLRLTGRLAPPEHRGAEIAAVLRVSGAAPPEVVRGPSAVQRAAGRLRAGLREASTGLSPDARALLPGLVVGDTSQVSAELEEVFRATDLTHLLSVSGANLTIVIVLLVGPPHLAGRAERRGIAPRLGIPLRSTAVLAGALTLAFVVVCRPEPSVLRAAACGALALLAIATGRRRSLLPALAAAVLLLVLYDPGLARSYGFLLSVLATGALLTIAPGWSRALARRGVPERMAEVLAAAAAAQAVCGPVIAVLAGQVSLVAVPCNLLAELAVAPATVLGFATLAVAPLAASPARGLAWLAGWPTEWIAAIARTGAGLPGAVVDWPGGLAGGLLLAAVTVALVLLGAGIARRPWLCAATALLLVSVVLRPTPLPGFVTGWPPPGWRMAVCQVGQGDALVLSAGNGQAVVVDAGPSGRLVDRCLRRLGVARIPLVVLTHFHADHVGGLSGVLRGRAVGAIETTTLDDPPAQAAYVRRIANRARVPVLRTAPGERSLGPLRWQVLWPPAGSDRGPAGDGANNASVTLLVRTAGITLLLLGDLEPPSQRALLTAHPELPEVDVLKVAHHGSRFQDPALLRRTRPRLALISCGENPYGHPAPRTLGALRAAGAVVLRTDTDGGIAVTARDGELAAVVEDGGGHGVGADASRAVTTPDAKAGRPALASHPISRPPTSPRTRRRNRPAAPGSTARQGRRGPGATVRPRRRPHRPASPGRARVPPGGRSAARPLRPRPRPPRGRGRPAGAAPVPRRRPGRLCRGGAGPQRGGRRRRWSGRRSGAAGDASRSCAHCAAAGGRVAERLRGPAVGAAWDA